MANGEKLRASRTGALLIEPPVQQGDISVTEIRVPLPLCPHCQDPFTAPSREDAFVPTPGISDGAQLLAALPAFLLSLLHLSLRPAAPWVGSASSFYCSCV